MEEIIDWEAAGFTVVARCGCGREALLAARRLSAGMPSSADIRMPDMSGIELMRQIRAIPVPAECIVVSAYSDFEVARQAIRLSAVHYLLKPLVEADVREAAAMLRRKLDATGRPVQRETPILLIDEKNPAFPITGGGGANPGFLLLSDSPGGVFSLQNVVKGYCQPVRELCASTPAF